MKILVVIGPSGTGKSTLMQELHTRGIVEVFPSWTTRPRRLDETGDRVDHHFVGEEEFDALQRAGFFLEVADLFGSRYGLPNIPPPAPDRVPAIVVRAPLLDRVAKHFPDHVVYQVESAIETARQRIAKRKGARLSIDARLASYAEELSLGRARCTRWFETSNRSADVVAAVQRAIEEDFHVERSRT